MINFNLRNKMICCFCLHLTFYVVYGLMFLKDFNAFNEDVTLLMHAGNLSNICLEIRRYEKNYIISHDDRNFKKVGNYVNEAQKYLPEVKNDLILITHPLHLDDLQNTLENYKAAFQTYKDECSPQINPAPCTAQLAVQKLGKELVETSEQLVLYEQQKMTAFVDAIRAQLYYSIAILALLSIFTVFLLYGSIIIPLKSIELAAADIAAGTFRRLRISTKKDEVTSVLHAFNNMVTELEQQQEQLFQAKKLSSIGTLASGTAHQINNPLNNIATSCQLALSEINPQETPFLGKMLNTIDQETQRAGEIVKGLLEFSRVHTFSLQPIPLQQVIDKTLQLVASEVPAGINIKQEIEGGIVVLIDIQKMIEALLNLIINGVQAIERPPGEVVIAATAKEGQALITISDTGAGIHESHLQKVFDPFFTTKKEGSGTGLGLAVVFGIIKKHRGTIRVDSQKGEGTCFSITLPLSSDQPTSGLL